MSLSLRFLLFLLFADVLANAFRWRISAVQSAVLLHATPLTPPLPAAVTRPAYGSNNFGDIMAGTQTNVTVNGNYSPLERIVITANGNLQRILSAYYGAPVTVVIKKCDKVSKGLYDREVDLVVNDEVVCTALGQITLYDNVCIEAVESKSIGVGQLFRYMGVLPVFSLIAVGRSTMDDEDVELRPSRFKGVAANNAAATSLWREYELKCPQIKCRFTEVFRPGFLDLH